MGSTVSFLSRDLPNEIRAFWCPLPLRFGGGLACLGAGMLNSLEIILSWLQSRESGTPARSLSRSWGERLVAGWGFGGGGGLLHSRQWGQERESGPFRRWP